MHIHSEQHMLAEELFDTLFFCTGKAPVKVKTEDGPILHVGKTLIVVCKSFKNIWVNGYRCKSAYDAKQIMMYITE